MIISEIPEKKYYSIGETSELLDIKPHILRYWEQEFPLLRPRKTPKGHRLYTRKHLKIIVRIHELLYTEKFTVEGARKKLNSEFRGESVSLLDRRYYAEKLRLVRDELRAMLKILDRPEIKDEGDSK